MKIRMLTSISGNADERYGLPDFSFRPGETTDVHKDLAAAWIAAGHAEKVKGAAVSAAPEVKLEEAVADVAAIEPMADHHQEGA